MTTTLYIYRSISNNKHLNIYIRDNYTRKCKEARQQGDSQPLPIMGWFAIPNTTALSTTLYALGWNLQQVITLPIWLSES